MSDLLPEEQQSFDSVANTIIRNSIQSVLCIDDEYSNPYEPITDNLEKIKALYTSFRDEGCSLDIYRYSEEDWDRQKNILSGKDLLILDWQLKKSGAIEPTLSILENCIEGKNIPYICIYTNTPVIDEVFLSIYLYFSTIKDIELKYKEFNERLYNLYPDEYETILTQIKQRFQEYLLNPLEAPIEVIDSYISEKNIETDINLKDLYKIVCTLNGNYLYKYSKFIENIDLFNENKSMLINNTLIHILNKSDVDTSNLYTRLIDNIYNVRDLFVFLFNTEIKNIYKNNYIEIGRGVHKVSELAFFHYQKQDSENFSDFINQIYINNIIYLLNSKKITILEKIEDYKNIRKINEPANSSMLFDLNLFSSNNVNKKKKRGIIFGDIFKMNKNINNFSYIICITQNCDCYRPNKINNNFMFVFGEKIDIAEGLKSMNVNREYLSFINNNIDRVCIKWKNKPFSIYIPKAQNEITSDISCRIQENSYKLSYIVNQKENHTQRLANHSFSDAMRVGIDFAKIELDNTFCERCGQKKQEEE